LTLDSVVDAEGSYFIGHNDEGARVIESLRAHGLQIIDGRQAFFEGLGGEPESEPEINKLPEPLPAPPPEPPPAAKPADVHLSLTI
jgi:hypothetical protein